MNEFLPENRPRSLACKEERDRRLESLSQPHIRPLKNYAEKLENSGFGEVPYFDPIDGGINAQALFLLEKPGPKADASGFISRDNNDPTAEATFNFMQEAGIDRELTCLWNVVPGWNGTRKIKSSELKAGFDCLRDLFLLLPNLKVVVLVGKKAQRALPYFNDSSLTVLSSYHPSPINRATTPDKWQSIPGEWKKVLKFLEKN